MHKGMNMAFVASKLHLQTRFTCGLSLALHSPTFGPALCSIWRGLGGTRWRCAPPHRQTHSPPSLTSHSAPGGTFLWGCHGPEAIQCSTHVLGHSQWSDTPRLSPWKTVKSNMCPCWDLRNECLCQQGCDTHQIWWEGFCERLWLWRNNTRKFISENLATFLIRQSSVKSYYYCYFW